MFSAGRNLGELETCRISDLSLPTDYTINESRDATPTELDESAELCGECDFGGLHENSVEEIVDGALEELWKCASRQWTVH